ncbi:MAG: PEP-CTERM sorting domain-containing protein [Pirellulales bacterium]
MKTSTLRCSLFVVALAALAHGPRAQAATVSYSEAFSIPVPGSHTVTLPQWDPALFPDQKLTGVKLVLDATAGAHITQENNTAEVGLMGVILYSELKVSALTINFSDDFGAQSAFAFSEPSDGTPGSGPDLVDFGIVSDSETSGGTVFTRDPFIGNGSFPVSVSSRNTILRARDAQQEDSTITVTDYMASGTLTMVYTYSPVPEPTALAMLTIGCAGLAAVAWRRRVGAGLTTVDSVLDAHSPRTPPQ